MAFPFDLLAPMIAEVERALDRTTRAEYRADIEHLNALFDAKDEDTHFRSDLLPTFFGGNIDAPPGSRYVLFSLNPGFDSGIKKQRGVMTAGKSFERDFLDPARRTSVETYLSVSRTIFERSIHLQRGKQMLLPFYETFFALLHGLAEPGVAYADLDITPETRMLFFQRNLITLDLIPYHAARFVPPQPLTAQQAAVVRQFWQEAQARIDALQPRLIIVNSRVLDVLRDAGIADARLDGDGTIIPRPTQEVEPDKTPRTPRDVRLWAFRLAGSPAVTFDHFITGRYGGFTPADLHNSVAPFITAITKN